MTTAIEGARVRAVTSRRERLARAWDPGRLLVRIGRSLWMGDRALAELRWAGVTLVAMAALALVAKVLDPSDAAFDRAIVMTVPAATTVVILGWSVAGPAIAERRWFRLAVGPALVVYALVAAGPIDLVTLEPSSAASLGVLALAFSAITPGFPLAFALVAGLGIAVAMAHAWIVSALGTADLVRDEFVVQIIVVLMTATGIAVVVRVAIEAEERTRRLVARGRRRIDDLERVERVVRRFDGSRSVRDVIQSVVDDISRSFDIALVSMYLPDSDGRLSMVGVAGYHTPFHVIDMGVGVIGRAAVTQETQYVPDVFADPDYRAARDDVRNEVAAPIVHDGELLGVVNFEGTEEHPLSTGHMALAEMLARTIAASLHSARLDEERRARLHAIERVLDVSRGLVSDLDRRRTIAAVVDAAVDVLSAETVVIAGHAADGRFHVEGDSADPHDGSWRSRTLQPATDPVAMEAIESGVPVVRHATDGTASADRSTMALPIRIDGVVAAILVATRPATAPAFGPLDLSIGDLLATQVGVALHNAERHASVSDAALRDPLTGLLNRRFFDEAVETAFAEARRDGAPLSLIVLDLDRFSAVNNEHGHPVGDAVLRRVAEAMLGAVRVGDIVARYGGEEFVVIAPGATTATAVAIAERIRSAVATSDTADGGVAGTIRVTVSAGVASLLGDELDGRALFRAADSALLTAKRAGRDRVVAV